MCTSQCSRQTLVMTWGWSRQSPWYGVPLTSCLLFAMMLYALEAHGQFVVRWHCQAYTSARYHRGCMYDMLKNWSHGSHCCPLRAVCHADACINIACRDGVRVWQLCAGLIGVSSWQAAEPHRPRQVPPQDLCSALVGHDALCLEGRYCHHCYVCPSPAFLLLFCTPLMVNAELCCNTRPIRQCSQLLFSAMPLSAMPLKHSRSFADPYHAFVP